MADGATVLRQQIARLRKLGNLTRDAAPAVAQAVKSESTRQVARGVGPDGQPWALTKTGERPLQAAANAITVAVVGTTVILRLTGHHARHHFGAVKGKIKRLILPTAEIPDPFIRAITRVLTGEFHKIMGSES